MLELQDRKINNVVAQSAGFYKMATPIYLMVYRLVVAGRTFSQSAAGHATAVLKATCLMFILFLPKYAGAEKHSIPHRVNNN